MIKKILLIAIVIVVLFLVFRNVEFKKSEMPAVEEVSVTETMPAALDAESRTVSVENSKIVWFGENKIQAKSHTGTLMFSSESTIGFAINDEGVASVVSGEFVVDMQSLAGAESEPEALVEHIRSADFFDVANYPDAKFNITEYGQNFVRGLLTIKGVTEEVIMPYSIEELQSGGYRITGEVSLDRTVWGVTTLSGNFFDNVGDNIIEDIIVLSFDIQTN